MALSTYDQIIQHIKDSQRVVLALEKKPCVDNLGAAFALSRVLNYCQKPFQITIEQVPKNWTFLTHNLELKHGFKQARRLVITLDITDQGLDKFYYTTNKDQKQLEIFIVPHNGFFNPDDVRVGQGGFEYDLVVTLGAADLFSLGNVYQNNTAFFHETLIINIDSKAANEKFGEVNLVEPTKSSVSEVVFDFLETNFRELIDKQTATAILAGILEKTQSFRAPTLAPQTLEKASRLLGYKADRELVVRELFYNKSLSLVKLWGRVLARLKESKQKVLYWSLINTDDYTKAQADPDIVEQVFAEVLGYLPQQATILLFSEFKGAVSVLVYSGNSHIDLAEKLSQYKLTKTEYGVSFKVWDKGLLELENEVIALF